MYNGLSIKLCQYPAVMYNGLSIRLCQYLVVMDNSFVEQVDDPAMYLSLYGVLWSLGIQYK
jgi:hypothetical protein